MYMARPGKSRHTLVYYDAGCGLCRATLRWLARLDVFGSLEFRSALDDAARQAGLCHADLAGAAQLVTPKGKACGGFYAFRQLTLRLPALWPLAPALWLPGANCVAPLSVSIR